MTYLMQYTNINPPNSYPLDLQICQLIIKPINKKLNTPLKPSTHPNQFNNTAHLKCKT